MQVTPEEQDRIAKEAIDAVLREALNCLPSNLHIRLTNRVRKALPNYEAVQKAPKWTV